VQPSQKKLPSQLAIDAGSYAELRQLWHCFLSLEIPVSVLLQKARGRNLRCLLAWLEGELEREDTPVVRTRSLARFNFRLAGEFNGNLICVRFAESGPGASVLTNVPRAIARSGAGFDFGGEGAIAGVRELALNVLHYYLPPLASDAVEGEFGCVSRSALELYEAFAAEAIARQPSAAALLTKQAIEAWILQKRAGAIAAVDAAANVPVGAV